MPDYNVLREYYTRYLRDVRETSIATVNHYTGALNTISKYLVNKGKINESIYEIGELAELEAIRQFLYSQPDFIEKDERGNRMYSAGLNNYIRFAEGEELAESGVQSSLMDVAIPLGDKQTVVVEQWKRSGIVKKQSIKMANYLCEIDHNHTTFISAATGEQYMEGHHAIWLKKQAQFDVNLDIYANIICLCPICHRLLHYGVDDVKKLVLYKIYADRAERLYNSGIRLSRDEFVSIAI